MGNSREILKNRENRLHFLYKVFLCNVNARMAHHDVTVLFRKVSDFHFSTPRNGQ